MEDGKTIDGEPPQNNNGPNNRRRGRRKQQAREAPATVRVLPPASPARPRRRHFGLLISFVLVVLLPTAVSFAYLYMRAADQYASTVGFAVRKEEGGSSADLLGGLSLLAGSSSSSDTDILYEFIQSQELVERINARLDLKTIYAKPASDFVFGYDPEGSIEDLVDFWGRMVRIYYDSGTGLIELLVLAFEPQDAQRIAQMVFDESSAMINELTAIAREDMMQYARTDLDDAVERLKQAREAVTAFRSRTQIVNPTADIQGQMGLLSNLQQQLAEALIELDLLADTARDGDPRTELATRKIAVIKARIADERRKFGVGDGVQGGEDYATLVAEYERLNVDLEFAENAYTAALSAFDQARAEAVRQSRYLAAYVKPTLAQKAEYPRRLMLGGIGALFLLLTWAIGALIYYSIRDRR